MSTSVLVGYATRYGSTQEVAEAVGETLRGCGLEVDIQPASDVRDWAAIRAWASALAGKLGSALTEP
jgi:menaquinone-dependent protoporphyrinogen oxidase